jgi:methylenetetrahydrofolate dehydrogenase (NADP+)/methenyltetrahydrofolate cyclohydrolase
MATLIDGKAIAAEVRERVRVGVEELTSKGERAPGLAVVLVGEDPASQVYVRNKTRACEKAGMVHRQLNMDA